MLFSSSDLTGACMSRVRAIKPASSQISPVLLHAPYRSLIYRLGIPCIAALFTMNNKVPTSSDPDLDHVEATAFSIGWAQRGSVQSFVSFEDAFMNYKYQNPTIHVASSSIKSPGPDEEFIWGSHLKNIATLDVTTLRLGEHDFDWAKEMLAGYGPVCHESPWESRQMARLVNFDLFNESGVQTIWERVHLRRILCAGVFLWNLHRGGPPETTPSRFGANGCSISDSSTSGPSGRPDIWISRSGNPFVTTEIKPGRACRGTRKYQEVHDKVRDGHPNAREKMQDWQKSQKRIIYQVRLFIPTQR